MNERDLFHRMQTQRPMPPQGFEARQEAELVKIMSQGRHARRMTRRTMTVLLAAAMLLCVAVAGAAGYLGLSSLWYRDNPLAEGMINTDIKQTGGETSRATYTVLEAIFDGSDFQAAILVQPKNGMPATTQTGDLCEERMLYTLCDLGDINGHQPVSGGETQEYREDGSMIYYVHGGLAQPLMEKTVHVTLELMDYTEEAGKPSPMQIEHATLTFDMDTQAPDVVRCEMEANMEGWLTIRAVEAAYTPLGVSLAIDYLPGERLGNAWARFFLMDGEQRLDDVDSLPREGSTEDGFTARFRFYATPASMPNRLTLGVEGLSSRVQIDFDKGTATVVPGEGDIR